MRLKLRPLDDGDIALVETWLNTAHVKRWFEIPRLNTTIEDWMKEIREYRGEYRWITYFVLMLDSRPIGMCQYYKCADSVDEDYGTMPVDGSYGIDYLIGEEDCLGRGFGREMVSLLASTIFQLPDARRVTAHIDTENTASRKTLLSCGFRKLESVSGRYVLERRNTLAD